MMAHPARARTTASEKDERYVMLLTAALSMWNMGVGYGAGLVLWHAYQRAWLKA